VLERLRLPLKRKRSLSSEEPDSIKKERNVHIYKLHLASLYFYCWWIFLYLRSLVMWVFPLLATGPVLIFNGSGLALC
jgi:hypothetical protein